MKAINFSMVASAAPSRFTLWRVVVAEWCQAVDLGANLCLGSGQPVPELLVVRLINCFERVLDCDLITTLVGLTSSGWLPPLLVAAKVATMAPVDESPPEHCESAEHSARPERGKAACDRRSTRRPGRSAHGNADSGPAARRAIPAAAAKILVLAFRPCRPLTNCASSFAESATFCPVFLENPRSKKSPTMA